MYTYSTFVILSIVKHVNSSPLLVYLMSFDVSKENFVIPLSSLLLILSDMYRKYEKNLNWKLYTLYRYVHDMKLLYVHVWNTVRVGTHTIHTIMVWISSRYGKSLSLMNAYQNKQKYQQTYVKVGGEYHLKTL